MSELNLNILPVPRKSNIVSDVLLHRADLDPTRVSTVSVSVKLDLLAAIHLALELDSSDTFRDLKRHAIASDRVICMHDRLVCCTSCTKNLTIMIPDDKALK